jgi:hypothetical protein
MTHYKDSIRTSLDRAREALADGRSLDAVAWGSAHLAAAERTLLPLAARISPDGRRGIAPLRRTALALYGELRRLEQVSSGDGLTAAFDAGSAVHRTDQAIVAYVSVEESVVSEILDGLDPAAGSAVVAAYQHALTQAPTRPHPHVPHRGPFVAIAFRVDALRDRVLNILDARHVPTPRRTRRVREPGRWGSYLLGEPQQGAATR